jgi:hypothetical protein
MKIKNLEAIRELIKQIDAILENDSTMSFYIKNRLNELSKQVNAELEALIWIAYEEGKLGVKQ